MYITKREFNKKKFKRAETTIPEEKCQEKALSSEKIGNKLGNNIDNNPSDRAMSGMLDLTHILEKIIHGFNHSSLPKKQIVGVVHELVRWKQTSMVMISLRYMVVLGITYSLQKSSMSQKIAVSCSTMEKLLLSDQWFC